jgi:hypothetical protein
MAQSEPLCLENTKNTLWVQLTSIMLLELLLTFCTFFVLLKVQNSGAKEHEHGFRAHLSNKCTKAQKVQIIFRIIRALRLVNFERQFTIFT